jgi:hypothetical protein
MSGCYSTKDILTKYNQKADPLRKKVHNAAARPTVCIVKEVAGAVGIRR